MLKVSNGYVSGSIPSLGRRALAGIKLAKSKWHVPEEIDEPLSRPGYGSQSEEVTFRGGRKTILPGVTAPATSTLPKLDKEGIGADDLPPFLVEMSLSHLEGGRRRFGFPQLVSAQWKHRFCLYSTYQKSIHIPN